MTTIRKSLVLGLVAAGALAAPLAAGDGVFAKSKLETKDVAPEKQLRTCAQTYQPRYSADLNAVNAVNGKGIERGVERAFRTERQWGVEENMSIEYDESGTPFMRVRYPKGSINPSNEKAPRGGSGFLMPADLGDDIERACLHYQVRFSDWFGFAKGGKLPGLYGGNAPSGGMEVDGTEGWSVRLMWRKYGQGELYEYVANKKKHYGASVGRGAFDWPTGRWVAVEVETILNESDEEDGIVRLWINGELVIEQKDVIFRKESEIGIDGIMFSTFFGGNSKSWKSPQDQHADFKDFKILIKE